MSKNYHIAVLAGDGIGPEVMAEALKVMDAVAQKHNFTVTREEHWVGGAAIDHCGTPLPRTQFKLVTRHRPFCLAASAARNGITCPTVNGRKRERFCRFANVTVFFATFVPPVFSRGWIL